jgi:hypothetical protein
MGNKHFLPPSFSRRIHLKSSKNLKIKNENVSKKVLKTQSQSPSPDEKVDQSFLIIFDWDDTLFCTSYVLDVLSVEDIHSCLPEEVQKFQLLENLVCELLILSKSLGETLIITNSSPGWVEYSSAKFMPNIQKILKEIKVVSARGKYENKFPYDSRVWKINAFLDITDDDDDNIVDNDERFNKFTNILCIGDSPIEIEAGLILASQFDNKLIKTIKFKKNPSIDDLIKQLQLVLSNFEEILHSKKSLKVSVQERKKER